MQIVIFFKIKRLHFFQILIEKEVWDRNFPVTLKLYMCPTKKAKLFNIGMMSMLGM